MFKLLFYNGKEVGCTSERACVDQSKIADIGGMINEIVNAKKGVMTMVKVEVIFEG